MLIPCESLCDLCWQEGVAATWLTAHGVQLEICEACNLALSGVTQ